MKKANGGPKGPRPRPAGLAKVFVAGYKSFSDAAEIEIRPLTLLAGANSSGKSSIMQPLLLMKQTLEAPYDSDGLKIDGPHVKLTDAEQMFWRVGTTESTTNIIFGFELDDGLRVEQSFQRTEKEESGVLPVSLTARPSGGRPFTLHRTTRSSKEISAAIGYEMDDPVLWSNRGFLTVNENGTLSVEAPLWMIPGGDDLLTAIRSVIHLPGLRGNPERSYPVTAIGPAFPGPFEAYTASVLLHWQRRKEHDKLAALVAHAAALGLATRIEPRQVQTSAVEVLVSRIARPAKGSAGDLVNIADVGFGVSQTLPVLVALQAALPGQIVYVEQPEIHLHPRAQVAMAAVLGAAAMRGVRVVVETHSDRLLLGVQTLVAEGKLPPELVKLHWFTQRGTDGATEVKSGDLDATGAFGDWPEDFADVDLGAQSAYLDASDRRRSEASRAKKIPAARR
jgi:predicted ATPase